MSGHNTRSMGDDSDYYNRQNGHSSQKSTSDSEPKSTGPSFSEMLAKSATTVKPHYKKEIKHEPRSNSNTPVKKSGAGFSDDEDAPLSIRMNKVKTENTPMNNNNNNSYNDDDDDVPLSARLEKSVKKESPSSSSRSKLKRKLRDNSDDDDDDDYNNNDDDDGDDDDHGDEDYDDDEDVPLFKRAKKAKKEEKEKKVKLEDKKGQKSSSKSKKPKLEPSTPSKSGSTTSATTTPTKKGKKSKEQEAKEEETKWKWWEEEKKDEGVKWKTLEHKGPLFAPLYERLPTSVHFYYDGRHVVLSDGAEEVAGFYARMLDHDYTTRDLFNKNYFRDWRKAMTAEERHLITDLKKCNFKEMLEYFKLKSEERKNMSKEEKQAIKKENEKIQSEYGFCIVDGHKQKIGNFRIEPPGLFRGRGEHPKQGMLKKRVQPEDVTINCSKGPNVPKPPAGHKWKEVRHDNTVTWLASWSENIQGSIKYVMLNAASRLKGEKDWMKYETARKLHKCIDKIRANYKEDWKSKEMRIRQRAVALYFIDKLALRAGNEKDEDTADTVGCCSLRYEHVKLHETLEGKECVVELDFLGKDSIRYTNTVAVEKRVFKNLQLFMENKQAGDDLFDRLNTTILNKHLQSLMDGLSAKVFRTYNASRTLQEQLDLLTVEDDPLPAKILAYNRANRQVAILCNHQRAAPKNFDKQMENLQGKIDAKKALVRAAKKELKDAKSDFKAKKSESARTAMNKKKKAYDRLNEQLAKLEMQLTDKDENKEIALGTSKLNYLDPRISIAWCKKWGVPIEKIYNKTQREKFAWAIDMAEADYHF